MATASKQPNRERENTDTSLRVERERTDEARAENLDLVDETADAVISKARARADRVLAAARARTDQQNHASHAHLSQRTERKRALEDEAIREERADADEVVRAERAELVAVLAIERAETDKDLSKERDRADDAVATRDDFLGIVSHDLRNMLGAVVGFADLIATAESQENHEAEVRRHVQRIHRAGARMNRLIGDLVDVASIHAGRLAVMREVLDPLQVVTEAVDTFHAQASASGVALVAEFVPPATVAAFDPARILQVLTNLLSNAIKFTPPGGKVVVRVEAVGEELRFAVNDTGVGIAPDKLEAVFERFRQLTTNDRRGVGLGLYISKCIVQGHGGRIWAESKLGEGTSFNFTLPTQAAPER